MKKGDIFSLNNQGVFDLIICRSKDNVSTELEGETVILDISSGIYSGLDPVGTTIWNMLEKPLSIAALRDGILEKYTVTEEQCVTDLFLFLKDLIENELICIENEPST
jgi:hypothetical protein